MLTSEEKRARLERALEYAGNTHGVDDIVALLKSGQAQWWSAGDGCIISEIHTYPRLKAVHYWLIFGGLRDCLSLENDINSWAVEQGCTVATACGRRGWGKVAAATGWREWLPNFQKGLTP